MIGRTARAALLALSASTLLSTSQAQNAPNCPLWGPIYPALKNVLESETVTTAIGTLKDNLEAALNNGTLGLANSSFHLEVFSADQNLLNYSYAAPQINDSLTAGVLNRDTVFRIGSIAKLVTVYALLAATGLDHINDPITKWVPELAAAPVPNDGAVTEVRWQDVTIGALAGHQAGLLKDFSLFDLTFSFNGSTEERMGLPALAPDEVPPCGCDPDLRACSREEFFKGIQDLHPMTAPFNMPIYSNFAFQILAYAVEGITNMSFSQAVESSILRPLNLNDTFLAIPASAKDLNAIIPGGEVESAWKIDVGDMVSTAQGFILSSGADMAAIGQSILSSSLLPPAVTRRWLKPTTNTPDLHLSIGMPWEIRRIELPVTSPDPLFTAPSPSGTRLLDLYTKNGGIGAYFAQLALSPDHGLGFYVTLAGRPPANGADRRFLEINIINDMVTEIMVPAFEAAAAEQAAQNFAGTYVATNDSSIEMTIVGMDGRLGLGVQNWTMGELDLLVTYYTAISGSDSVSTEGPRPSLRLYPVGLRDDKQVAFRGVFGQASSKNSFAPGGSPWIFGCTAWAGVGEPSYGNIGLDDFVFEVDETGRATAITARGLRTTLRRN
ncbi:hypothetical protein FDECE_952 [Fusarium decemcellulare]|nr:hypothetical protein FDECE_952 [Fusarium decemcellulare]